MNSLTIEHRLCAVTEPPKILQGLDALADRVVGSWRRRRSVLSGLQADVAEVQRIGKQLEEKSEGEMQSLYGDLKEKARRRKLKGDALLEGLAAAAEGAARQTGMRPYAVQLIGALAMYRGFLAEMATGEGKSLTASLAAVLAGWSGRPCHVVTVNDYLAERDAKVFEPFYQYCGVSVGAVTGEMQGQDRKHGHDAGVTYTTSKELCADFLRDRLCLGELQNGTRWKIRQLWMAEGMDRQGAVMRGLHTAIVDEADSVLIDEAVTPLIISGSGGNDGTEQAYQVAWNIASRLDPGIDYIADRRSRRIEFLPQGLHRVEISGERLPPMWRSPTRQRELLQQALQAREFFDEGKQYVVQEGKVVIVDEATGRLMPMRKWQHGLHQSIEAKEGLEVSGLDQTLARMSFQRFFRLFHTLSGMTGTGAEAVAEFWQIYRLPVVEIPRNRECQRRDLPDRVFASDEEKWTAVVAEIGRLHKEGRPTLVGTRSIRASEELAGKLRASGLEFQLLNAARHQEEAEIVEKAGEYGRITIATNMAGRGTDIKLGGGVKQLGGLHVLATERHESGRVDRQLQGRAGRQGDPGSSQAFVSTEDELLTRYLPRGIHAGLEQAVKRGVPGARRMAEGAFARAQANAQAHAYRSRKQVLAVDTWLNEALAFAGTYSQ